MGFGPGESYQGLTVPEGDPGELRRLGRTFSGLAGSMDSVSGTFHALPGELSSWQGVASVAFAGASLAGGDHASAIRARMEGYASATNQYAGELEHAQHAVEKAIEDAIEAQGRIDKAKTAIEDARGRQTVARTEAAAAKVASALPRGAALGAALESRAAAALTDAEGDERLAQRALTDAQRDLEAAKKRGHRAEGEAHQAATRAEGALHGMPGAGPGGLGGPAAGTGGAGAVLATILPFGLFGASGRGAAKSAFGELAPFLGIFGALWSGNREDRRVANDNRLRIPPGGRTGRSRGRGGDFESDWAGRELLGNYLAGGGDMNIRDNANWTKYMEANPVLAGKLNVLVQNKALRTYDAYQRDGTRGQAFNDTGPMEIQNGESISGYQYLHGTNADAGGFNFQGRTTIDKTNGGYEVHVPARYTWNDRIDPNGQYRSDQIKSTIAEIVTLGRADSYNLHLSWNSEAVVRLDERGNVTGVSGYPGK